MLQLSDEEKARGVVASSAGNHAQAVAYLAQRLGIESTIVMPENAPLTKVSNTRHHGAEVVLCGMTYQEAYAKAVEIQEESGATFIHPFDDEQVIAGQGTIALELLEQEPELEAVLAEEQANVIEVYHERSFPGGPIDTTEVLFTLETRGREHAEAVLARLEHDGFYPEEIR